MFSRAELGKMDVLRSFSFQNPVSFLLLEVSGKGREMSSGENFTGGASSGHPEENLKLQQTKGGCLGSMIEYRKHGWSVLGCVYNGRRGACKT